MSSPSAERLPRLLSGIQPTADSFHLGNYLGAIRNAPSGRITSPFNISFSRM